MKNKIFKAISLLLVFCLVLGLSGCAGKVGDSDGDTAADGRRILKWEVLKAGYGTKPYEKLAEAYMKEHPDVLVKINFNPDIRTTTAAKLESNNKNISDIYSVNSLEGIKRWAIKGWVEPIDDVFDAQLSTGKTVRDSMTGNAADSSSYNGTAYAIPEYMNLNGFVYNKSLFDKYGWKIPKTTTELDKLCRQILADTGNKVAPIVYCGAAADGYLYFGAQNWIFEYEGIQNLDRFYAFKDAEVFNPNVYKGKALALQNLKKFLFDDGRYTMKNSAGMTHIDAQYKLISGDVAMMLNGSWFENEMSDALAEVDVDLGMFAVPEVSDSTGKVLHADGYTTVDGKRVISAEYGSFYFIPSAAANKTDAKDFLKFLSEPSSCELYTKYTNAVRAFDYEVSPDAATYAEMSTFGKSVLSMAHDCYIYAPYTSNPIAIQGLVGLWARGKTPYIDIRDGVETVNQAVEKDYEYAKNNWSNWVSMAN